MSKVLVVAPHPDDETLGCGGTLLRHVANGDEIHWLIVTCISEDLGFSLERIAIRESEISKVEGMYPFKSVQQIGLPTTKLDTIPLSEIVTKIGHAINVIKPDLIYTPYRGDVHSDHAVVFDSVMACSKWFRYPFVKRILVYETLSETDFGINPDNNGFRPNVFVNIDSHVDKKIEIMSIFKSELGNFPYPRSEHAIRSLASVRGASSGFTSAECFMSLKEVWS